eukprot:TRINITY_DN4258_c0_g1_i6.p1 TRINITY_DN4258_c0_g1~~TRINITY_DN4258_c0_g1_i6.p1  ORF type:complete len:738 (+),score=126.67 TRINITY_DN4258_c0_g1_i6:54-2267(+)
MAINFGSLSFINRKNSIRICWNSTSRNFVVSKSYSKSTRNEHLKPFNQVHGLNARLPDGYWKSQVNVQQLIEFLQKELNIRHLDDWYRVSRTQINRLSSGSRDVLQHLPRVFPEHQWDLDKLWKRSSKSSQRELASVIRALFPHSKIVEEYRDTQNEYIELDLFLPKERLAFEYQGEQHFRNIFEHDQDKFKNQLNRDERKRRYCQQHGITLIEIPFWWDGKTESIHATIHQSKKGYLEPIDTLPIPSTNPQFDSHTFLDTSTKTPSRLMYGSIWDRQQDLVGWWLTETMEGLPVYWDGTSMYSRNGTLLKCHPSLTQTLPKLELDGNIWTGGNSNFEIQSLFKPNCSEDDWKYVSFVIFDLPSSRNTFEERMIELEALHLPPNITIAKRIKCESMDQLQDMLHKIKREGGKGLTANHPDGLYVSGKTDQLLTIKHLKESEVRLLEILPSGLFCLQSNGHKCTLPYFQFISLPPIGSVLIVKHDGYSSSGTIKSPLSWHQKSDHIGNDLDHVISKWDKNSAKRFFDSLANKMGLKGKEDWYGITQEDVAKHGGSVRTALRKVYPDHPWLPWRFNGTVPARTWNDIQLQRQFMNQLAERLNITRIEDWYHVTKTQIREKGGLRLLCKYQLSPSKMVMSILSDHTWNIQQFNSKPKGIWDDMQSQREFLDHLSKQLKVNTMDDWYHVTGAQIRENKGGGLLEKYQGSPYKMITSVLSDHNWDPQKFVRRIKTQKEESII